MLLQCKYNTDKVQSLFNYQGAFVEDKKFKVLLAANFQRPKTSEAKQRKVADEYVKLCGYKNGGDRYHNTWAIL